MSFCDVFNTLEEACNSFMDNEECKNCTQCVYENGTITCKKMERQIMNGGFENENK